MKQYIILCKRLFAASCALNDYNAQRAGKEPPDAKRSAFKSFYAQCVCPVYVAMYFSICAGQDGLDFFWHLHVVL